MVAPPTNPVHLFRALLRECTYLPDPCARTYMHNYVLWSYRTYLPKIKQFREPITFKRQVTLMHRGRKVLSLLHRANDGYLRPLEKVLMMTYGRRGKRRRELMQELMAPAPLQTSEEITAFTSSSATTLYQKGWTPPPKVDALMRSQSQQRTWLDRFTAKLQTKAKIPEENSWGKPMPNSRVKNLTQTWYVKQVDHLFPPLPEAERQGLEMLATGEAVWPGPIPRRKRIGKKTGVEVELEAPTANVLLEGPQKGHTFSEYMQGRPHQLNPRLMRRLYAVVFRHVPYFEWNEKKDRWVVQWGNPDKPPQLIAPPATTRDALLFSSPDSPVSIPA